KQITLLVCGEGDDLKSRAGQFLMESQLAVPLPRAPDSAGGVIPVKISSIQSGKFASVIDDPAGQGAEFRVGMFDRGRHDGCRSAATMRIKRMAALDYAPSIIISTMDQICRLPQILPVVADPDVAGLFVNAHAPGVAKTVCPGFRPCVGL